MIDLKMPEGYRCIELGCGDRRHPAAHVAVDVRTGPGVDFAVNFEETPWPISSEEFDVAISFYVLEHISWRNTLNFLKECFRVLKPGGKLVLLTPDTEAQMRHLLKTSDWDDAGSMLFGDLNYPENSHKAFVNPAKLTQLLRDAGFTDVLVSPFGEKQTDMLTQALKPVHTFEAKTMPSKNAAPPELHATEFRPNVLGSNVGSVPPQTPPPELPPAEVLFDRRYWDGGNEWGGFQGGYRDFACHEVTAQHVLARRPKSVLELGCARGYVLKRLEDAGVACRGLDASKHCHLTRVASSVSLHNFAASKLPYQPSVTFMGGSEYDVEEPTIDLCFSIATLDHVAEKDLPRLIKDMASVCKRGLHGINFSPPGGDRTRQTCRPREWWVKLFETHAPGWPVEILDKDELENGNLPPSYLGGDGRLKLNVGSYTTMFHHGWLNVDAVDLTQYAQSQFYKFKHHDVREGLPFDTESVHCIYSAHMLEHLTYSEGLAFLKECRRVLRPDGAVRIIVPDADLIHKYACGKWDNWDDDYKTERMRQFDELSGTCAASATGAMKLYELLHAHHHSMYDSETLCHLLREAGLYPLPSSFRTQSLKEGRGADSQAQILRETLDVLEPISLFTEAYVSSV